MGRAWLVDRDQGQMESLAHLSQADEKRGKSGVTRIRGAKAGMIISYFPADGGGKRGGGKHVHELKKRGRCGTNRPPQKKGLPTFVDKPLFFWCARQDSNLRPTDS